MASQQLASALSQCFQAFRLHFHRPFPAQIHRYPLRRQKILEINVQSLDMRVFEEYLTWRSNIGLADWEILTLDVLINFSKARRIEASQRLPIARISTTSFTPLSPQPCMAWHGHRVTNALHEVDANGLARVSPSGPVAAAPPADAA
jgi:hypothetical protein